MTSWSEDDLERWLLSEDLDPDDEARLDALIDSDPEAADALDQMSAEMADAWFALATPVAPSAGLKSRLMASIQPASGFEGFAQTVAAMIDRSVEVARDYFQQMKDPDNWFPGFGDGMQILHVDGGPDRQMAVVGFIQLAPGAAFPPHEHVGDETVFVLQGRLRDVTSEQEFGRGQIARMDADTEHELIGVGDEPTIYLTVVERGLRINGHYFGPEAPEI